jgi:MFS family permease
MRKQHEKCTNDNGNHLTAQPHIRVFWCMVHSSIASPTDLGLRKRGCTTTNNHPDFGTMMDPSQSRRVMERGDDDESSSSSSGGDDVGSHNSTGGNHHRSLDDFLEHAYSSTSAQGSLKYQYWMVMLALGIANSSDASEILCISYILSDPTFEENILNHESWRGGLLASAVFLGMLLGGLFIGTLGDWMGRRPILLVGLTCNAISGILSALAPNVWVLSLLRCIAGIGIGTTVPPLFTLVTELAPPSQRGLFVTFCASFWMVGSLFVAVTALVVFQYKSLSWIPLGSDWRIFAILCAVPSAVGAVMVQRLVPESPRFLALQQRHEQALTVANKLAQQMDYDGPSLTMEELKSCFPLPASTTSSTALEHDPLRPRDNATAVSLSISRSPASYSLVGFIALARLAHKEFSTSAAILYTPELRQTTLPLQMVWFSLSFGSYGLMTWINRLFVQVHLENVYFNALLFALANLPGNIFSAVLMDRIGRNTMLVSSILAAAAGLVSFAFFANATNSGGNVEPSTHALGIVMSACAFQCFTIAAWNTIDCMTSELFATTVRATGMGICAASGRIGALVAQLINGVLVENPVQLLLVASLTLLLGAMTPCLLPKASDMTGQAVQDRVGTTTRRRQNDDTRDDTIPFPPVTINESSFSVSSKSPILVCWTTTVLC